MSSRQQMNIKAIQARHAAQDKAERQRSSWKTREGGINSEIYDNLGERDKGRVEALGGHIPHWAGKSKGAIGAFAGLPEFKGHDEKGPAYAGTPNNLIESAAWEMGYGNVKDEETFQKVLTEIEDQGFSNFDSQQDVHRFRENWTKKMIKEHAPKPEKAKEEPKAKVKSEPSKAVNKARAFVGQQNYEQQAGAATAAKFGTPPPQGEAAQTAPAQPEQELPGIKLGQASSFANKYKEGIKGNLVPTTGATTSQAIADAAKQGLGPDTQKATDPRSTWGADRGYLNTRKNPDGFW